MFAFLNVSSLIGYSQSYNIDGIIRDNLENKPLSGANVVVKPIGIGTTTNNIGYFVFKDIPAGTYEIIVSHIGFEQQTIFINVKETNLKVNFVLEKAAISIPGVVIKGKPLVPYSYVESKVLAADIEQAAARDIGDYMRTLPNISGVRKGGTSIDPVIRGFKFFQINNRVDDGIRIEGGCPNRMDPTAAHIPIDDIEKIEIIKGPYALKYGVGFGGYINLITSKPEPFNTSRFEVKTRMLKGFESNWNGQKEHITLKAGNNKIYFNATGSRMDYNNYKDGDGNLVPSKFKKYAWSGEIGFKPFINHELQFSYNEHYNRNASFPSLPMDDRIDNTRLMFGSYTFTKPTEKIKFIKLRYFNSDVYHVMDNKNRPFADTTASTAIINAITQGGSTSIAIKTGESGELLLGGSYENTYKEGERTRVMYLQYPINGVIPKKKEQLMDSKIENTGAFAQYTNTIGKFEYAVAARIDLNHATTADTFKVIHNDINYYDYTNAETNFTNFSFSAGIDRMVTEELSFGLSLGRGVRSPDVNERYASCLPVGYDFFDYIGNPHLKPEANHQIDLSGRYNNNKLGTFELTGFYSYVTDFISSKVLAPAVLKPNTANVIGVKQFINLDNVSFKGFEFSYATPSTWKLGIQMSAAYTMAVAPESYGYEVDTLGKLTGPAIVENDPLPEIPPFETNLRLNYKLCNGKFVPRANLRFVASQNKISVSQNERKSPGFTLVDLGFKYQHSQILTLTGGVNNLFDHAYFEHLNRRLIGTNSSKAAEGLNLYEPGRVFFVNLILTF